MLVLVDFVCVDVCASIRLSLLLSLPLFSLLLPLSAAQQDQLVQSGVIPRLVAIMREYPENDPLVNVCLLALCNLADMGEDHQRNFRGSQRRGMTHLFWRLYTVY